MNLKELSEKLGLSQTTVSRALNGYPEVSEATRLRITQAAEKYKYKPNTRAKGLATGRAFSIGHVIPLSSYNEIVNPIFADFIAGAGEVYSRNGYDLMLSVVHDDDEEKAYREMASKANVDGVIIHSPKQDDLRINLLKELAIPFMVHGRSSDSPEGHGWVDVNNKSAFKRAAEYLLDLGHNRIALINGDEVMHFAARRRLGYEEALLARGIDVDQSIMTSGDMTESAGYEFASKAILGNSAPTAYLVSSMLIAIGVRRAVQESGLKLGEDISIVTHDDDLSYLPNSGDIPMFTATRSSVRAAGKKCAEMLLDVIEDRVDAPGHELWEAELLIGASSGVRKD